MLGGLYVCCFAKIRACARRERDGMSASGRIPPEDLLCDPQIGMLGGEDLQRVMVTAQPCAFGVMVTAGAACGATVTAGAAFGVMVTAPLV